MALRFSLLLQLLQLCVLLLARTGGAFSLPFFSSSPSLFFYSSSFSDSISPSAPAGRLSAASRYFYWRRPHCLWAAPLVCRLRPTANNSTASGELLFRPVRNAAYAPWRWRSRPCRVRVTGTMRGLSPGKHGLHVHSFGDERADSGSSLGGHFANPWFIPTRHGLPDDDPRHWGDFGNFVADANGTAPVDYTDRIVTLRGIVGRGMVVHAGEDKGKMFQPSGASGPRAATCVIGYANPDL